MPSMKIPMLKKIEEPAALPVLKSASCPTLPLKETMQGNEHLITFDTWVKARSETSLRNDTELAKSGAAQYLSDLCCPSVFESLATCASCPCPCGPCCGPCGPCCGNAADCNCGRMLPPPCNTPPKCLQYMQGYYYYPYGTWFCGPYHVNTGGVPCMGPVCPGTSCGIAPPNPCNVRCGPCCGPCGPCCCGLLECSVCFPPESNGTNQQASWGSSSYAPTGLSGFPPSFEAYGVSGSNQEYQGSWYAPQSTGYGGSSCMPTTFGTSFEGPYPKSSWGTYSTESTRTPSFPQSFGTFCATGFDGSHGSWSNSAGATGFPQSFGAFCASGPDTCPQASWGTNSTHNGTYPCRSYSTPSFPSEQGKTCCNYRCNQSGMQNQSASTASNNAGSSNPRCAVCPITPQWVLDHAPCECAECRAASKAASFVEIPRSSQKFTEGDAKLAWRGINMDLVEKDPLADLVLRPKSPNKGEILKDSKKP